jgi:methylamine--corrinoid protein Co-methyltransferase
MEKYLRFMKQALEGEEKPESQHDMAIFKKCRELCKKYDIHYNGKDFVSGDAELADSVFKAALELLDSVGIYCTTTGRTIKLNEEEIEKTLQTPKTLEIGRMREKVLIPIRAPMDKRPPVIIGGPMGGAISEENFLAVHLSAAKEPTVQGIYAGAIQSLITARDDRLPERSAHRKARLQTRRERGARPDGTEYPDNLPGIYGCIL